MALCGGGTCFVGPNGSLVAVQTFSKRGELLLGLLGLQLRELELGGGSGMLAKNGNNADSVTAFEIGWVR